MLKTLQGKFASAERQREMLLAELATWTPEQLAFKPSPTEWSALEVVDHLVRLEEALVNDFATPSPDRRVRFNTKWRARVVNAYLRSHKRFTVPKGAEGLHPSSQPPSLVENTARWDAAMAAIAKSLDGMTPADVDRTIMRHPRAGWFGSRETLRLMTAHTLHHRYQVERIKKASSST